MRAGVAQSDWSPPALGSALVLWLQAGAKHYVSGATNDIMEWRDLSGNGNAVTQRQVPRQPTPEDAGLNGWPSVLFTDTSCDCLQANKRADRPAGLGSAASWAFAVVLQTFGGGTVFSLSSAANAAALLSIEEPSSAIPDAEPSRTVVRSSDNSLSSTVGTVTPRSLAAPHVCIVNCRGSALDVYVDDELARLDGPWRPAAPVSIDRLTVGAQDHAGALSDGWDGRIGELLAWNRALTNDELDRVRTELSVTSGRWAP